MRLVNNIHVFEGDEEVMLPDGLPPLPVIENAIFGLKLVEESGLSRWIPASEQELRQSLSRLGIAEAEIDADIQKRLEVKGYCSFDGRGCSGECYMSICAAQLDQNTGHIFYCYCYSGPSSMRYKHEIDDLSQTATNLLKLRPVAFKYKPGIHPTKKDRQYGFIAEEVEKLFPELVVYGADQRVESVQYHQLPALLIAELQRQNRMIEEQQQTIQSLPHGDGTGTHRRTHPCRSRSRSPTRPQGRSQTPDDREQDKVGQKAARQRRPAPRRGW